MDEPVVIVGAGPTGLMLAGWLARKGIRPLVLERRSGIVSGTRALGVQARSLELYDQLGLADQAVGEGLVARGANLWSNGRRVARADLSGMGDGISPFPFVLMLPQDRNEALLLQHFQGYGGSVEWNSELVSAEPVEQGFLVRWRQGEQVRETRCRYLCGCDGGQSRVREGARIAFRGGTYDHLFYVADVQASGAIQPKEINLCLRTDLFQAFFPMPGEWQYRLVGLVPRSLAEKPDLTFEDVRASAEERLEVHVDEVHSFSRYRVHHRKAACFRQGNLFLLGDAAHVHSPVGAQGMNTGLMDAANLGWKLAAVLRGEGDEALLDSYAPEREPFASLLVATTDRLFTLITSRSWLGKLTRAAVMPQLFRAVTSFPATRRMAFLAISQTRVHYRRSPLSQNGGERLPYVAELDNFAPLRSLDWQVHVYGGSCDPLPLPVHTFEWTAGAAEAGLLQGWLYLVRPDGYVAVKTRRAEEIRSYLRPRRRETKAPGSERRVPSPSAS